MLKSVLDPALRHASLFARRYARFSSIKDFLKKPSEAGQSGGFSHIPKAMREEFENPNEIAKVKEPEPTEKSLQQKFEEEIDLPFKLSGMNPRVPDRISYLGERIFSEQKIPQQLVLNHLFKIYNGVIYSIAAQDAEFLTEYCEKSFAERLIKRLETLNKQGYIIKAYHDVAGKKGEPIKNDIQILDMTLIKGLSAVRSENRTEKDYHKFSDADDMGLIIYTPLEVTNPENFIDPEQNKKMYDNFDKVLMRMLVSVESSLRLQVLPPGEEKVEFEDTGYSFKHTVIFETQMKPPPKFKSTYKLQTYMEWIARFNFGVWKVADLDNWMLGNPVFTGPVSRREGFKDEVFKGSKYDPKTVIDVKNI